MRFSRRPPEEAEINLIPFIDVLLVVLIFLMLSTTYARHAELALALPTAAAEAAPERPREIVVTVTADGRFAVDRQPVEGRSVELLAAALASASRVKPEAVVVVAADAAAPHQSVVNVLDAARRVGLARLAFAATRPAGAGAPAAGGLEPAR
jgi:biopolymer transport protein ExbD